MNTQMKYVDDLRVEILDNDDWENKIPDDGGEWQVVRNIDGKAQDFNMKVGGKYIYVYYRLTESGNGISAIRFIQGENTDAPAGWCKIDKDFNMGAGGKYIYLCFRQSSDTKCIARFFAGFGEGVANAMNDFQPDAVVLRQDLNEGAGGKYIFLGYYYV